MENLNTYRQARSEKSWEKEILNEAVFWIAIGIGVAVGSTVDWPEIST